MVSNASFGAMFTWMMIFADSLPSSGAPGGGSAPVAQFQHVRGFPADDIFVGALLMAAVLVTTVFTDAFRLTLVFGLPFIAALCLVYRLYNGRMRDRSLRASRRARPRHPLDELDMMRAWLPAAKPGGVSFAS